MGGMEKTTVYLPDDLKRALRRSAKSTGRSEAELIRSDGYVLALTAIPLMFAATLLGRRLNSSIGERGFSGLFWLVMAGYTVRLAGGL